MTTDLRRRFASLHAQDMFVMPNPWDVGSARLLEGLGFSALATTSSGRSVSLGRMDQQVNLDELIEHLQAMVGAVGAPVSVDAEYCFSDTMRGSVPPSTPWPQREQPDCRLEDFNPDKRQVEPFARAVERVGRRRKPPIAMD